MSVRYLPVLVSRVTQSIPKRALAECTIGIFLFSVTSTLGMTYVAVWGEEGEFYQREYGPAVMLASGHGFVNPIPSNIPGLKDFLSTKTPSLDAAKIPSIVGTQPLTQLQTRWLYQLHCAGMLWSFFGISWKALLPMYGVFFGLGSVAVYALFRLAMGYVPSLVGTAVLTLSPFNLYYLPFLRDYSKVPFILLSMAIFGYLVKCNLRWRSRFTLAAAVGVLLGVGLGFRKDVVICIPAGILTLALLIPGHPWQEKWRRLGAIGLLMAGFFAAGWPMLRGTQEKGGTTSHVLILGLMEPFDEALGLGNVPYSFGALYMDAYVHNMAKDFAQRHGNSRSIGYATPQYDDACEAVYFSIVRTFPADILLRWVAATRRILDYGLFFTETPAREWTPDPVVYRLFCLRWRFLGWLCGYGTLIAAICVCVLSVVNIRYGLTLLFFILYFAGYSSLQFAQRHFFHLEVVFWWPFFFLLTQCPRWLPGRLRLWRLARKPGTVKHVDGIPFRVGFMRVAVVAAIFVLAVPMPVLATRVYQDAAVTRLLAQYKALPLTAVNTETREESGKAFVAFRGGHADALDGSKARDEVFTSYFVLEFQVSRPFWFWTRYGAADRANDFRRRVQIDPPGTPDSIVRYYLPVYEASTKSLWGRREFLGLTLEKDSLACLRGIYKVTDLAGIDLLLPLWMTTSGPPQPTHATVDSGALPFYPRWRAARAGNLIPNSEFDVCSPDGVPDGFGVPQGAASVDSVLYPVEAGRRCVRITWRASPGPTAVAHRFRTQALRLDASSEYELFVDAYNPSRINVHVSAWQIVHEPSGGEQLIRLTPSAVLIDPNARFLTSAGRFFTREEVPADVIIAVDCQGDTFPAVAYLDNLRLIRVE